jgi:sugar-phosphatase
VFVTADDVQKGKPDPTPYLKGAALLGFDPEECLAIEDAPAGVKSARAAGIKVIGLTSTFPANALQEADAIIARLGQIRSNITSSNGLEVIVS